MIQALLFIFILLLWTAIRETLLEKYSKAGMKNADRNSGIIVLGCFALTLVLLMFF